MNGSFPDATADELNVDDNGKEAAFWALVPCALSEVMARAPTYLPHMQISHCPPDNGRAPSARQHEAQLGVSLVVTSPERIPAAKLHGQLEWKVSTKTCSNRRKCIKNEPGKATYGYVQVQDSSNG